MLACAGLDRLGLESRITARLDRSVCLPAVGQGVIGIECRADDSRTVAALRALDHAPTRIAVEAERAFSRRLGGSCQSPIAAFAEVDGATTDARRARGGAGWLAAAARTHCRRGPRTRRNLARNSPSGCSPRARANCSTVANGADRCACCTASASWSRGRHIRRCRCAGCSKPRAPTPAFPGIGDQAA